MSLSLLGDIWKSYRRTPLWVQVWMAIILVPVNFAAIAFMDDPYGMQVAAFAVAGIVPNLVIVLFDGGFSKKMSLPHLFIWTPLVLLIMYLLSAVHGIEGDYRWYLWVLLIVDVISLGFDYPDAWKWYRGDRAIT